MIEWKDTSRGAVKRMSLWSNGKPLGFWIVSLPWLRSSRPFSLYRMNSSGFGSVAGRFKTLASAQRQAERLLKEGS